MPTIQQQLADLRRRLESLPADARAAEITPLEADARALLTASKNTPFEDEAKALFAALAKRTAAPAPAEITSLRGLLRRARIRMEIAADDNDFDEAIDILAGGLDQDPDNPDLLALLRQAASRSPQLEMKVRDLLDRYNVRFDAVPEAPVTDEAGAISVDETPTPGTYPPGLGSQTSSSGAVESGSLAEVSQAYYAGDYQKTIDLANRVLASQPDNAAALDYRQKAEDNLLRGVVPDHRIPFDARVAFNRANSLVRAGNYEEAERLYREARDLAERSGITTWKDAEQALLDIQDLALARELLADGDRLLASDDWQGALRKYEGSLRVVPSDPVVQERIELVKRIQEQFDKATVQLNMMSGSLVERVTNLQALLNTLASLRQTLPGSARLQSMVQEADRRIQSLKSQLLEQGKGVFTRAEAASVLEEKLRLTGEAVKDFETAASIDPGDREVNQALQTARQAESRMNEARQIIERSSALIAQNFDNELAQARTMLSGLRDYAQDPRYRMIVADLLARHLERIEAAIDQHDVPAAERWLALAKEDPFRILGRRSELLQLEEEIRNMQRGRTLRNVIILGGALIALCLLGIATRPVWMPLVNPPTATPTFTPSHTPLPTATYTPTETPTASWTPSSTFTPTFTATPSQTPTASWTPSDSPTPSITPTASDTPTVTPTPTITLTPSLTNTPTISPTPVVQCRVRVVRNSTFVRVDPNPNADSMATVDPGQEMDVLQLQRGTDANIWYQVRFTTSKGLFYQGGWIRMDRVEPITPCPVLPISE